ncbi:DUF484 family protein [Parasedimentitalea huanghaiensis]|uniref:DUF484 family protein n=1 Tax=Parasedimentitalea huanghaiensis TaxID=2682100 RepID=A0A6L6WGI0_9RHOB|nr:DUF484 family protein [Zongyanglinia huanghaiensis]MVO16804.1 DUF484 family protein [Zongyanglinia huanghaiensis]
MSSSPVLEESLRKAIVDKPDAVLEDQTVMNALVSANERSMGANIVDLRGIAMDRMEARLDRLEDTHRSVIAAAYDNLAGTNQIHRAVLRLMDPTNFEDFLQNLRGELSEIMRLDAITLVLESAQNDQTNAVERMGEVLNIVEPGFIDDYISQGRGGMVRPVTLRQVQGGMPQLYGDKADWVRSEACLKLDFGDGRLPGLLVMGAEDPHQFTPQHGTELLTFFGGVFERSMRHWLS